MGFNDWVNYIVRDNPVSKSVTSLVGIGNHKNYSEMPRVTVITEKVPLWQLASEAGPFLRIAGLMGASAVALGAYGAHRTYPKDKQSELQVIFETANRMHFFHSLAVMSVSLCKHPKIAGTLMISGTILFTAPLYYHAFTGDNKFGKLAPMGGTILILAWLSMVLQATSILNSK
ncbi:transmembrane protein 256 homolog [Anthonomus grandis grandis]|uniref:transmembrane protein 256 homolog n=1 Tax=Anthonomus grandis grandis TaxID=2921223 RepID=UPI002166001D|nr:transmembrane protein 256 homolog [Anthonomus grandis grandis]